MGLFKFLGVLSPAHIGWVTFSGGRLVGEDVLGNRYYSGKPRKGYNRDRRWVIYKGEPEASSVPPEWHGWLHHQTDEVPAAGGGSFRQPWQKPHQPNLTGTSGAYRPPGHILSGGRRDKATGDYEAWTPGVDQNNTEKRDEKKRR
jgi:NADH:ubiquinone oxidoreductase subunit